MDIDGSESDIEFDSDTSDSDDHDESISMYDGHSETFLSNLDNSVDIIEGYLEFERGFSYGDVVRFVTDPFGQMGHIVNMEMVVDLESSSGEILEEINSRKLIRIRSFAEGDYVVHGSWLGKVAKVYDLVEILLDDGTKYKISTADTKSLIHFTPSFLEDGPYMYFPGQRVKVNCSTGFESWLCGMWSDRHQGGTVCSVEPGPVLVNWITSICIGINNSPPCLQETKNLSLLSCFLHVSWQLGDFCKLPECFSGSPEMVSMDQVYLDAYLQGPFQLESMKMKFNDRDHLYTISRTKTYFDVLWQDGSISVSLDSQSLAPVSTVGDHDFWPEQFVLEKAPAGNSQSPNTRCLGIVKGMDAKDNIVTVKWVAQDPHPTNNYPMVLSEESHSAYELVEHPDFSFCLGDIVFRFPKDNYSTGKDFEHGCNASSCLSFIGNVVGRKAGLIEIKWASGNVSKVEPSEVYGIDKINIPSTSTVHQSEPTEGNGSKNFLVQDTEILMHNTIESSEMGTPKNKFISLLHTGSCLYPRAAVSFFKDIASSIFSSNGSNSRLGVVVADSSNDLGGNSSTKPMPPSTETTYVFHHCNMMVEDEISQNVEALLSDENANAERLKQSKLMMESVPGVEMSKFKKFDIVNDFSDHYFAKGSCDRSQVQRSWWRKVQEEWCILEADLPDSISVRVYDDRMDLLRASIVGAAGTPYHDALFFFDICFPPDYPNEPPAVHYISNGLRLNPNLYECGKVCLSLLNTWTGKGTEVWDSKHSTLLQVLLSLQALVLNAEPYFNEAGYDKHVGRAEGELNSITYNENAFLLSRKSMLYHLHQPPKHFEALVDQHFKSHSHDILSTCKSFVEGTCKCNDLGFVGDTAHEGKRGGTSAGFKIALAKLFPMLVAAFLERGIDLCGFEDVAAAALPA